MSQVPGKEETQWQISIRETPLKVPRCTPSRRMYGLDGARTDGKEKQKKERNLTFYTHTTNFKDACALEVLSVILAVVATIKFDSSNS